MNLKNRKIRILLWVLFAGSVYLILSKTLLNRTCNDLYPVKLIPFWEFGQWISGNGYGEDIIYNILLFIPFGLTLGLIKNSRITIFAGFALSLSVELLQLILRIGWFQTDDIMHNTLGTVIGYVVSGVIRKRIAGKLR